jgi:hypothetical protein
MMSAAASTSLTAVQKARLDAHLAAEPDPALRLKLIDSALCPPEPHLLDTCGVRCTDGDVPNRLLRRIGFPES